MEMSQEEKIKQLKKLEKIDLISSTILIIIILAYVIYSQKTETSTNAIGYLLSIFSLNICILSISKAQFSKFKKLETIKSIGFLFMAIIMLFAGPINNYIDIERYKITAFIISTILLAISSIPSTISTKREIKSDQKQ